MVDVLFILEIGLSLFFLNVGLMKLVQSPKKLHETIGWPEDYKLSTVRLFGVLEILGGLGVILPTLTGIAPYLSVIAATCLGLILLGAGAVHLQRGETSRVLFKLFVFFVAVCIGFGKLVLIWG